MFEAMGYGIAATLMFILGGKTQRPNLNPLTDAERLKRSECIAIFAKSIRMSEKAK